MVKSSKKRKAPPKAAHSQNKRPRAAPSSNPPSGCSQPAGYQGKEAPRTSETEESMATLVDLARPAHMMQPLNRPIRFVSNDGLPHTKRRRISAACKTCRKRKTRCSGEKPACETCRQNGHECLGYAEPAQSGGGSRSTAKTSAASMTTATKTTNTAPAHKQSVVDRETPNSPADSSQRRPSHATVLSALQTARTPPPNSPLSRMQSPVSVVGNRKLSLQGLHAGDDAPSPFMRYQSPHVADRLAHRMPYFRYFGPTAIVPGYKQMVVEVRDSKGLGRSDSSSATNVASPASTYASIPSNGLPRGPDSVTDQDIPVYDRRDPAPNHPLIACLVDTFFTHVGCNFPFLDRDDFIRDVKDKKTDGILVNAVCGIAARFSDDPLLKASHRSVAGASFIDRAKANVVDTFTCPTLSAVQACVLLAYAEFGCARDSGLWMFLGIAIRMAQDLGLQKLEGMRGERKARNDERRRARSRSASSYPESYGSKGTDYGGEDDDEDESNGLKQKQERTDTFWAVYFLDRVISSGTGRPVTLRDAEIEVSPPRMDETESETEYPQPFPALIRVIRLYGQATDLLNNIKDPESVTPEVMMRLSGYEADLTTIYQGFSSKLHFNGNNFQHYCKANQTSVFLLLHFWFHALIVLLHRPTLFIGFEGRIRQLFPNSHELSMSSAKTIADIAAFAELIDVKAVTGNPFTSQPIYIAGCAFLQESANETTSRPVLDSPTSTLPMSALSLGSQDGLSAAAVARAAAGAGSMSGELPCEDAQVPPKRVSTHALAAQQNYQHCYKAVKSIETYWTGVRYILTVMDQKAKGVVDPLLYTDEELSADDVRRWGASVWMENLSNADRLANPAVPPLVEPNTSTPNSLGMHGDLSQAIGWSWTGTTNSPNGNLSVFYPAPETTGHYPPPLATGGQPGGFSSGSVMLPYTSHPSTSAAAQAGMLLDLGAGAPVIHKPSMDANYMPLPQVPHPIGGYAVDSSGGTYGSMFDVVGTSNGAGIMLESGDVDVNDLGVNMGSWMGYLPGDGGMEYYGLAAGRDERRR